MNTNECNVVCHCSSNNCKLLMLSHPRLKSKGWNVCDIHVLATETMTTTAATVVTTSDASTTTATTVATTTSDASTTTATTVATYNIRCFNNNSHNSSDNYNINYINYNYECEWYVIVLILPI